MCWNVFTPIEGSCALHNLSSLTNRATDTHIRGRDVTQAIQRGGVFSCVNGLACPQCTEIVHFFYVVYGFSLSECVLSSMQAPNEVGHMPETIHRLVLMMSSLILTLYLLLFVAPSIWISLTWKPFKSCQHGWAWNAEGRPLITAALKEWG